MGPRLKEWARQTRVAFNQKRGVLLGRLLDPSFLIRGNSSDGFTFLECASSAKTIMTHQSPTVDALLPNDQPRDALYSLMSLTMSIVQETLVPPPRRIKWDKIVELGTRSLEKIIELFEYQYDLTKSQGGDETINWLIPILVKICSFLTNSANQADEIAKQAEANVLQDASEADTGRYQKQIVDAMRRNLGSLSRNTERLYCRSIMVVLMSGSIKVCIALSNLKMTGQFTRMMDQIGFHKLNLSHIPHGPLVTYRSTLGLLSMQQEQFSKAEKEFVWAITHMPERKYDDKRDLIDKLIVVRLRLGILPPLSVLENYNLATIYGPLVKAIRTGHIKLFEITLNKNAMWFVRHGTLLIVERSKFLCFRTLLHRTVDYYRELLPKDATQPAEHPPGWYHIPLQLLTNVFRPLMASEDPDLFTEFDEEEMGCIISAVISRGYLKGYIAWRQGILVLSKQMAFPQVASVNQV